MGYTHLQMKTLKLVGTVMALHVLAYIFNFALAPAQTYSYADT